MIPYPGRVTLESLLGPICLTLSIAFIWPQVARVYRQNTVEGLSPLGILQSLAGASLWTVYGGVRGVAPVFLSSAVILVAMSLIAAAMVRHGALSARQPVVIVASAITAGLLAAAVSPVIAGIAATVVGATSIIPQTVHALRSDDVSGISVAMYALVIVNSTCWLLYGIAVGDLLVSAPNLISIPCAGLILAKVLRQPMVLEPEPAVA